MEAKPQFSHINGRTPGMVDVSHKQSSVRLAKASSFMRLPSWVTERLKDDGAINEKGPVFHTAIIAGTLAAKSTSSLIPFCHPLKIDHVLVDIVVTEPGVIRILCTVKSSGSTGVEMEALIGATVAALTIYDMCKSASSDIVVTETRLLKKIGGKSEKKGLTSNRLSPHGRQKLEDGPGKGPSLL